MKDTRWLVLAVVLHSAGANAAAARQLGSVRAAAIAQIEADSSIVWSAERPLVRTDFKGPVPAFPGDTGALTVSGLLHAIECDAKRLEYAVYALFQPSGSWTRPEVMRDGPVGARELAHEQGHFDLTELEARRFRAELLTFNVPCESAVAAFEAIAQAAEVRLLARQRLYDTETIHAFNGAEQERWLGIIRAELDSVPAGTIWTSRKFSKR